MSFKDFIALFISFILGIPASMIASFAVGPLLNITWSFSLAKFLARTLGWTAPAQFRRKGWTLMWEVESETFERKNLSPAALYTFLSVVAVEWQATTLKGETRTYRFVGRRSGVSKLTGRWYEKGHGGLGYLGALQAVIHPMGLSADGLWIGFSQDNTVKSGKIELRCS